MTSTPTPKIALSIAGYRRHDGRVELTHTEIEKNAKEAQLASSKPHRQARTTPLVHQKRTLMSS